MVKLPEGIPTNHEVWHPTSPDALSAPGKAPPNEPSRDGASRVGTFLCPMAIPFIPLISH